MSDSSEEEGEGRLGSGRTAEDLSSFLAKVDEIGDLVHGLASSTDKDSSSQAIKKADNYLQREVASTASSHPPGQDRTVINRSPPSNSKATGHAQFGSAAAAPTDDMGEFCKAVEEDAREREQKRKEREKLGKEWKRKGTQAFRRGEFQAAADNYSEAIKQSPWDISLYTNMALAISTGAVKPRQLSPWLLELYFSCKWCQISSVFENIIRLVARHDTINYLTKAAAILLPGDVVICGNSRCSVSAVTTVFTTKSRQTSGHRETKKQKHVS